MSQTENSFKNSLRNFQLSRNTNTAPISLPTNNSTNIGGGGNSAFQSFRDSASNAFSNVSNSVQGYMPIGGNVEEEEDPWYQLSRVEVNRWVILLTFRIHVELIFLLLIESYGICFMSCTWYWLFCTCKCSLKLYFCCIFISFLL
jgi:hypothetical protein